MPSTILPPEYVDHVLTSVESVGTGLRQLKPAAWLLLAVAAAVEPERRAGALAHAQTVADATGRGALLEVVRERVTGSLSGTGFEVCPNPAQVRVAIDAALAAAVIGPDIDAHLTGTLTAALEAFRCCLQAMPTSPTE